MNRPNPQPTLVLFDLDDTLCDYAGARTERLRIAFELARDRAGTDFTAPLDQIIAETIELQPHGVDRFPEIMSRYGITDRSAIQLGIDWFIANRFHGLQLFPTAIETLSTVRAAGPKRKLGLVTNGPAEVQSAKIELLGLRSYFDFCLISGEIGFWKPAAEIFLEALRRGNASANNSVMIGDSPIHDMAGAQGVDIATIWMNRADLPWPQEFPRPTWIASDLRTVEQILAPDATR